MRCIYSTVYHSYTSILSTGFQKLQTSRIPICGRACLNHCLETFPFILHKNKRVLVGLSDLICGQQFNSQSSGQSRGNSAYDRVRAPSRNYCDPKSTLFHRVRRTVRVKHTNSQAWFGGPNIGFEFQQRQDSHTIKKSEPTPLGELATTHSSALATAAGRSTRCRYQAQHGPRAKPAHNGRINT